MQFKIVKILNNALLIIGAITLAIIGGYFYISKVSPEYDRVYMISGIVVIMVLFFFFKWLENSWDKSVITKMAKNGKIALAEITGAQCLRNDMRDSGFTRYKMYEFTGEICDQNGEVFEKTFYEKMNYETTTVPKGNVYITYDESKPAQIFIIPNAIISHIPELMPVVTKYEKTRKNKIKYLDVYYNKGIVIKTFKESLDEQRHAVEQKKLLEQEKIREKEEKK